MLRWLMTTLLFFTQALREIALLGGFKLKPISLKPQGTHLGLGMKAESHSQTAINQPNEEEVLDALTGITSDITVAATEKASDLCGAKCPPDHVPGKGIIRKLGSG